MKVVGLCDVLGLDSWQRVNLSDIDRRLFTFGDLDATLRQQERFGGNDEPQSLESLLMDEEIRDAGLVLQADEAMSLGRARALAADDHAADPDRHAMREDMQISGALKLQGASIPPQLHRVRPGRGSLGGEVGRKSLTHRHAGWRPV